MGACDPKRQIRYEKLIMDALCEHIQNEIPSFKAYSFEADEIIIRVDESLGFSLNQLRSVVSSFGDVFRIETFELDSIPGTNGWCKFYYDNKPVEFKCLNSELYHIVFKYYYGEPITQNDLVFNYNGALARFLKPIPDPFEN